MLNTQDESEETMWDGYWQNRCLSRNRTLLYHHRLITDVFRSHFASKDTDISILDIGCGDGYYLDFLRNLGFTKLKGIDLSSRGVKIARAKGHDVDQKDVYELKADEKYDAAVMMDVIEHFKDPLSAIKIIDRVLNRKGFIYACVPICNSVRNRWRRFIYRETRLQQVRRIDETHLHALSLDDFRGFAGECGLTIEQYWLTSNPFPFFLQRLEWLHRTTLRGSCGDHLSIILSKA